MRTSMPRLSLPSRSHCSTACAHWSSMAQECTLPNPIPSNPIQSHPIPSNPIQSNPIQSNPIGAVRGSLRSSRAFCVVGPILPVRTQYSALARTVRSLTVCTKSRARRHGPLTFVYVRRSRRTSSIRSMRSPPWRTHARAGEQRP